MDTQTVLLVVLSVAVGVCGAWILSAKRQIRSLQEQIAGLISILTHRNGAPNEYDREVMDRLGGARGLDFTPGGVWYRRD